jgi:hypothetical protein
VLGLSVNQLRGSGLKVSPEQSSEEFEQTASRQRQEYPALMSAEMDAGGIVVIEGGWTGDGPHGFVPWVLWGMVTEAGSDGTILGATFNGHADNPIHYIDECWGLHPEAPSISAVDADLEMLRRAIARIRGGSEMFSVSGMLFGLSAMDKWIQQMREVQGFCPGCFERAPDHAWGDANDNAQTLFGGALSVSKYFRDRLGDHPAMAAHLEATAKCYDRIAEIIEPSIWKDSPVHYRTFIGDLDKQKKHADEVLRPIKRELSAAANELEKAI